MHSKECQLKIAGIGVGKVYTTTLVYEVGRGGKFKIATYFNLLSVKHFKNLLESYFHIGPMAARELLWF